MGGAINSILSVVTGGLVKSPEQKRAEAAQEDANKQQQALLDRQSAAATLKAKSSGGAGTMSLLSGAQTGVDEKKKVLGQ